MIETMFKEVQNRELMKGQSDVPAFAKDLKPKEVTSYDDANQPIYRYVETRNKSLEGDLHPITGVPFENKTIELPNGEVVEGVFPEFPYEFEVKLDEGQFIERDARQFDTAMGQLSNEVEANPEMARKFTPEQIEQIKYQETPDGYVWHHSEQPGVLQLVDKDLHDKTGHTGGRFLWGGGSEYR